MKHALIFATMLICLSVSAQMNPDIYKITNESFKKTDKKLNDVYQEIMTEYKADTAFVKNLRLSQRLWIQFRDAELRMKYPASKESAYGSAYPLCVNNYLEKLTKERAKTLKVWLDGIEESDACAGTVKVKKDKKKK